MKWIDKAEYDFLINWERQRHLAWEAFMKTTTRPKNSMINLVCDKCGSEELEFDALAVWDKDNQEYYFELCEGAWCNKCNDTVSVREVEITDTLENYIKDGLKKGRSTSMKASKD